MIILEMTFYKNVFLQKVETVYFKNAVAAMQEYKMTYSERSLSMYHVLKIKLVAFI